MPSPLETRQLAIGYRRRRQRDILLGRDLALDLQPGSLVGLLGANGIGKSTLLRTLAGLQAPLGGQVLLEGEDVAELAPPQRAQRLSVVLTRLPPLGLLNGYGLVAMGRQPHSSWLGRLSAEDRRCVDWALAAVDGLPLVEQAVQELSDGQRQKLMIARCLAQRSPVMLLDEPTAYLDLAHKIEVMVLLKRLAQEQRLAILVSTHELDLALRCCDRLWLMSADGIEQGEPRQLLQAGSISRTLGLEVRHKRWLSQLAGDKAGARPL